MDWSPIILTFELALITTILLFVVALPMAYALAFHRNRLSPLWDTLISMPLVLPPTVIGFYLLLAFSPNSGVGSFLEKYIGFKMVFSFEGLVVASMIYSLPFMVQPLKSGFLNLPASYREAAIVMGKNSWQILRKVLLPSIKPAILTATVLSFAHTVGEFGVVLMIGGNIPDQTRVASIAIYDEVEKLNYDGAHAYSAILFGITFAVLLSVHLLNQNKLRRWWA